MDVGYARYFDDTNFDGITIDVYFGYRAWLGLVPELKVGFQYFSKSTEALGIETNSTVMVVPLFGGARYVFTLDSPVELFAAIHAGVAIVPSAAEVSGTVNGVPFAEEADDTESSFALDGGFGAHYRVSDQFGLGAALWYLVVFSSGKNPNVIQVTADLRYKF